MHKVGFFRSIQLKFIVIYILLILVAVQVIGSYFVSKLEGELLDNFLESVEDRIDLLGYNLEQAFNRDRSEDGEEELTLQEEVQQIVEGVDTDDIVRLQVVNSQGRVLGTNDYSNTEIIGKKTTEDAILKALLLDISPDKTLYDPEGDNRVFVKTVSLYDKNDENNIIGVIYYEASLEGVYGQVQNINEIFFRGSILAMVVSAILGILVARTITKPIKEMRRQAKTMARGDFSQKVNVYSTDEIGQLAVTFNDMNDRLRLSYARNEREQRRLSSVLKNMSDGVIATDSKGTVTLMNDAAGHLVGQNPDDVMGELILDVLHLDEKVVDVTELKDSGSMIIDFSEDDYVYLLRANFSTVMNEDEQITGFITVISDVTEQEQLERERREFVSNVSHELRTPLTTMRSYVETLTEGAWQDKELAPKFLEVTQNETDRMIRMVNDLLQLSRMDQKDYSLQRERVEFVQFLNGIIDRFEMNVPEQITLLREIPNESFSVWIDKDKMTQVLDNIISNAIKYSPEGGKITFKVTRRNHQMLVSIADEGMGIPYDRLDKIFERFYRADKARTRKLGGTGLGLAITKELVEAHHGTIWARSREGKGTTIFFTLPLMSRMRRRSK
ncbi:cell wall metabolism sensor histidine kinase WalK [Virgibacillus sp. MSJ-26]|uniref:cell wall metabolism sensor histidine kinase WalK n=1 Tax=Virgibacillus sp. MSJ-26 TaxID=2841522 RepID=UPI001C1223EA|nr:cell wall metabolism sensor histidine kinase WalK [Virgibacillus sp. MSJ-26]MBU5467491.1 cell wall metabolism sensor histidine kinase WalK [Virgibacillus sp. MSJ-26]